MNISDEAVEAAWATFWDVPHVATSNVTKREIRAALEAAAPHLMAAAWERGRVDGYHHRPNPYKETK